jgi:hypothetical protein
MIYQIHLWLTIALCTLIWFVQIVHYPSFEFYEADHFKQGMLAHQKRISYLVIPLMLSELLIIFFSIYLEPNLSNSILFGLVIFIWISTYFVQVPIHTLLTHKKDRDLIEKLVQTNWIRTVLWSLKLFYLFTLKSA